MGRKVALSGLGALGISLVVLLAIQMIPYGRDHTNPPVQAEPNWDSAQTRDLAVRACYDCHSNETNWPWYSNIAPISWLVQRDVDRGRHKLNLSQWGRGRGESENMAETVQEGQMPPWFYTIPHPNARLSSEEKAQLVQGLQKTFGVSRRSRDRGEG